MTFPATSDLAMVGPAMADQATTDQATDTETVDDSVEEAFFERAPTSSARPVSFDTEPLELGPSLELEARELRRVHFARVVGAIIATLGIGALLALVQPGPRALEAAPVVAAYAPQELPEMQLIEPAPAVPAPAPKASVESAPVVSAVKARPRAPRAALSAGARLRAFAVPPVAATSPASPRVNLAPPAARFAD